MSKQQQIILTIILNSADHLSAEDVYIQAKRQLPSLALGTVYRNLNVLTRSGRIRRIAMAGSPDRYDRILQPHEHLICQRCGRVMDSPVKNMKAFLEQQTGVEILGYELNIRTICPQCKKEDEI